MLTWVTSLKHLQQWGPDPNAVVKEWNLESTRSNQITGNKASAVRLLLTSMPPTVLEVLQRHVSRMGWSAAFASDDLLAEKKAPLHLEI